MIAIDIDSTLYDFATPARQAFLDLALKHGEKEEYFRGGYQSWVEWRSPADACGLDAFQEVLDIVHSPDVIREQTPYPNAKEVIDELAEEHEIFYISNRDSSATEATAEWLGYHAFPEAELIATMEDKQPYLSECQYLIDDRAKTLVQFVHDYTWKYTFGALSTPDSDHSHERKAFGLLFEYNRNLTDIPGIYLAPTWSGIAYYLKRTGVITDNGKAMSRKMSGVKAS